VVECEINGPDFWLDVFPHPRPNGHKYDRGHALIFGAPELTGATRLAAGACSRIGAGLVTVLAPMSPDVYRFTLPADIMVREKIPSDLTKINVVLGGSGGLLLEHRDALLDNLFQTPRIFDADAIPGAKEFSYLDENCVLTPHDGEFARSFSDLGGAREEMAVLAAKAAGAVIVLKGAKTIVAHPDGRMIVNDHASPYLAKAGTGDVLAGMITGLIAQKMPIFEACCAAVWMHGEAAIRFGPGLIASDIADLIPKILSDLLEGLHKA
jgi:hydroxyethylthiazole kinase-like uncharacterized protein yjeF